MLRESLARALGARALVTSLSAEDHGGVGSNRRYDIVLTSTVPTIREPEADVVLHLSGDRSEIPSGGTDPRRKDVRLLEDILAVIDGWTGRVGSDLVD